MTKTHKLYELALRDRDLAPVIAYGSAGTGKTCGAVGAAIEWLEKDKRKKVLVTRPNVSFAKEGGFLPGTEREKIDPWVRPIQQNFNFHGYHKGLQECLEKKGQLQYMSLEFIQGMTFDDTFIIVDECFTGDTEVLTEEGYVRFDELGDQKVAQVINDRVEFVKPLRKVEKEYNGMMAKVGTGRFSLAATANHDFVYRNAAGDLIKQKASWLPRTSWEKVTSVHRGATGSTLVFAELQFAVAMQADGTFSSTTSSSGKGFKYWEASFSKERKIERLENILEELGVKYTRYPKDKNGKVKFYIPDPTLHSKFLTDGKKFKVEELLKLSSTSMELFIDEVCLWDGTIKGTSLYCSTDYDNIKAVQTIAHLVGCRARIMRSEDHRKDSYKTHYRLSLVGTDKVTLQRYSHDTYEYKGKVYCCTVPSGMIMVRQNENIVVTGNCQNMSFQQLKVFLTRTGKYSKVVLCGDVAQVSPKFRDSGLAELLQMIEYFNLNVHTIEFTKDDILRSDQCKAWLEAFEAWEVLS